MPGSAITVDAGALLVVGLRDPEVQRVLRPLLVAAAAEGAAQALAQRALPHRVTLEEYRPGSTRDGNRMLLKRNPSLAELGQPTGPHGSLTFDPSDLDAWFAARAKARGASPAQKQALAAARAARKAKRGRPPGPSAARLRAIGGGR